MRARHKVTQSINSKIGDVDSSVYSSSTLGKAEIARSDNNAVRRSPIPQKWQSAIRSLSIAEGMEVPQDMANQDLIFEFQVEDNGPGISSRNARSNI